MGDSDRRATAVYVWLSGDSRTNSGPRAHGPGLLRVNEHGKRSARLYGTAGAACPVGIIPGRMADQQPAGVNGGEEELWRAAEAGEPADLRRGDKEIDDPVRGAEWGPERTVRAEVLRELLLGNPVPPRAVVLRGARIKGGLNLEAATLACPSVLDGCFCDGTINLQDARADTIRLLGCKLDCVAADQLETRGNAALNRSTATIISLSGARLGGNLILNATKLAGGSWPVKLEDVSLIPPTYAQADREHHMALYAGGLTIDGDMFCRHGFTTNGQVCLLGARVGRQLILDDARLNNNDGIALYADRLNVGQNMFFRCASVKGAVRLRAARVNGQLVFTGARLSNGQKEAALDLADAKVSGSLWLRFARSPKAVGGIDLSAARLGRVLDSERTWPRRLRLRGCVYSSIDATEDATEERKRSQSLLGRAYRRVHPEGSPDLQRRLRWIVLAEEGERSKQSRPGGAPQSAAKEEVPHGDGYAPQPYAQLMAYYRQEGRDDDARRIAYQRERRRRAQLGWPGRAWSIFLQGTVGYGYRPWRALAWILLLVAVGTIVFSSFHDHKDIPAPSNQHPRFVALIYTLDRLVPVVSFGLRDAFAPTGAAQWWAFAYTLLGWALTIAVVAGLTAAVRRD